MNTVLFWIFVAVAAGMVLPAFWRKECRLQFPCLAGLTVLFQVAIPLAALNADTGAIAPGYLTRFSVMAILCLACAWAGYAVMPTGQERPRRFEFNLNRLKVAAVALTAFGFFFALKYRQIEPEYDPEKAGMTGIGTIYATLATVMRFGFLLAAILLIRTRDVRMVVVMLPQLWAYYDLVMVGRRSPAGELVLIVCLLLFFYRKWSPPLWLLGTGMALAAVWCFNIGVFRANADLPFRDRITAIMAAKPLRALTLEGMIEQRNYVEISNAANFMEAKVRGGHYTFGRHFWNQAVFGFVPAQFVGEDFKESLKFKLADDTQETGFEKPIGTCESGIAEAFMAFGYGGCVIFFGLGACMRRLWEGANGGSIVYQFLQCLLTLGTVMSFSSQIWTVVNGAATIGLFAGPLFLWSRERPAAGAPAPARPQARKVRGPRRPGRGARGEVSDARVGQP